MSVEFFLQIALAKGVGDVTIKRILHYFSDNHGASWDLLCSDKSIRNSFFWNKPEIVESIALMSEPARRIAHELERNCIKVIFYNDDVYPKKLKELLGDKCPPYLFYKGNISLTNKKTVGFCGSRKASLKGMAIAHDCASQLVKSEIVVVSGYAAGIDIAAHKAALTNSGETIFVLAEGILKTTLKKDVRELLNCENHLFVSQFMPESVWTAGNAMNRNRVILGLSDAMILVESGKKGGTFEAGNAALSMNHPLFVIDFAQPEVSAEANPYFISRGGIPIRGKNGNPNLAEVYKALNKPKHFYNDAYSNGNQFQLGVG